MEAGLIGRLVEVGTWSGDMKTWFPHFEGTIVAVSLAIEEGYPTAFMLLVAKADGYLERATHKNIRVLPV